MSTVSTQQALNRMLEAVGLPAREITERDFLESACHEALVLLADGYVDAAKTVLRKALES